MSDGQSFVEELRETARAFYPSTHHERVMQAATRLAEVEAALTTIAERATQFREQAERAGRPSQAQWRGIEQVALAALSKGDATR